jgi:hypothetical protein
MESFQYYGAAPYPSRDTALLVFTCSHKFDFVHVASLGEGKKPI